MAKPIKGAPVAWGPADRQAAVLAAWGLSNRYIENATGLTTGQITYRLKRLNLFHARRDYREGKGDVVAEMLALRTRAASKLVQQGVEKLRGGA